VRKRTVKRTLPRLIVLCATVALVAAACGGGGDGDVATSTPITTRTAATATSARQTNETTPTAGPATASPSTPTSAGGDGGENVLRIIGENVRFDTDELEAAAGEITVDFDHRDAGVAHNFAVYLSPDDLDSPVAATEIESGPVTQTLRFTLPPGEYFYQCDVHPATMTGTLIVR